MPWVKIADATASNSRFIANTSQFIIPEGIDKSKKVFVGDLIVSNSATPGLPKFMAIDAWVHDGWLYEEILIIYTCMFLIDFMQKNK